MARVIDIDDGGSFGKLMEEVKKEAEDDSKVMELLELRIVAAFVNKIGQEAIGDRHFLDTNFVPKKKRSCIIRQHNSSDWKKEDKEDWKKEIKRVSRKRRFESENKVQEMIKKPKKSDFTNIPNELRERIKRMEGEDIKLVIIKQLFATDLNPHHDRLSIPLKQIIDNEFLTEDEKKQLINLDQLDVTLLEPCGSTSKMVLRQWKLQSTYSYVLRTSWKSVLQRNLNVEFKLNDIVQLWSFRIKEDLCFALVKVWDAPTGTSDSDSSSRGNGDGASTSHSSTVVD